MRNGRSLTLLIASGCVGLSIVLQLKSFDKQPFLASDLWVVQLPAVARQKSEPHTVSSLNATSTFGSSKASRRYQLESWEIASAMPQRDCKPPDGIPNYCCLGSISAGGEVRYNPQRCRWNISSYNISEYLEQFVPDSAICDVCGIVDLLLNSSLTLSFLGDSITRQTFVGLECEIRKHYHHATITRETIKADRSNIETRLAPGQPAWRYGLTETVSLGISTPIASTTIHVYGMYRPFDDMEEVMHVFNTSDVVVFDFGLHFVPKTQLAKFRNLTSNLLQTSAKSTPHLLVWRETSAQHFDNPGGHFGPGMRHHRCVNMTSQFDGVRLPVVEEVAKVKDSSAWNGTDSMLFIPYREFTSGLIHLHDSADVSKEKQDCTHFCNTPFVWLPIWRHLRIGMEKYVGLYGNEI